MRLNDDETEIMIARLQDKTHLGRFNHAEVLSVLTFLQDEGCDLSPKAPEAEPEVITISRTDLIQWPESDGNETHTE